MSPLVAHACFEVVSQMLSFASHTIFLAMRTTLMIHMPLEYSTTCLQPEEAGNLIDRTEKSLSETHPVLATIVSTLG